MSSNGKNGKEKLIAKLQHYYDSIINLKQANEDYRLTSNDLKEKEHRKVLAECYDAMSLSFAEIFKEFLYNADGNES